MHLILGKDINELARTVAAVTDRLTLDQELDQVSEDHIHVIRAKRIGGEALMGVLDEIRAEGGDGLMDTRGHVDPEDIKALKLDNKTAYRVDIEDGRMLTFTSSLGTYKVNICANVKAERALRIPDFDSYEFADVNTKDLKSVLDTVKGIKTDSIVFSAEPGGDLRWAPRMMTRGVQPPEGMGGTLPCNAFTGGMGEPMEAIYDAKILSRVVNTIKAKKVHLKMSTDTPQVMEWTSGEYRYQHLIAPKIPEERWAR